MKSVYILSVFFAIGVISCKDVDTNSDQSVKVISGATLFNGNGGEPVGNSIIVVRDDRIDCAGAEGDCGIPDGAETIDATGKFITPGLVDVHMHFFQTGFFDSRPDALDLTETYPFTEMAAYQQLNPDRYYRSYLCSGVTAVYDVGGMSWSVGLQDEAESDPKAPHVAAAGPLITPVQGAPFDLPSDKVLVPLNSAEDGVKTAQYLTALGSTGIKFWTFNTGDEDYMNRVESTAEEISRLGNQMIAHATTLEQAKASLRNGAKLLVHSVSDTEVDEEFIELAKENETIYNPTLIVSSGYSQAYRAAADIEPLEIRDPNGCVDSKTSDLLNNASQFKNHPRFSEAMVERLESYNPETDRVNEMDITNLLKVYEAGITIAAGTDAGNPGTLHGISIYDELEAMQQAGIPPDELIVMATRNGALAMQRLDAFGTIESGKIANLLMLDEDPSEDIGNIRTLNFVMIKGMKIEPESIRE